MSGFESVVVPGGGARLLRERKRETEEERQKLERKEKWKRIEIVLRYIILMCYMIK